MAENKTAVKTGGGIAKRAGLEPEEKTQKTVMSNENHLPPQLSKIQSLENEE